VSEPGAPEPDLDSSADQPSWFRRRYGAGPLHLISLLLCFCVAGYAASQIADVPEATRIGVWFIGAVVAHDLVLWPLYAMADRLGVELSRRRPRPRRVDWVNHVRVPAVISGVLLIISFPLVLNWSGRTYRAATGLSPSPFTARWVAVTAVLFAVSAVAYLVRWGRAVHQGRHR
jgi:Kef-type K+ transport system membrane component KefB